MLDRALSAALVCLRCQIRVAYRDTPRGLTAIRHGPRAQRWQSAVAANIQDDDIYYEDAGPARQETASQSPPQVADPIQRKRKPKRRIKSLWKPDRTAPLGVNVLGTPSEVLLLPPRDRQIPTVPQEEDISPKEHVYASLSSEKEPVQWEHVKENISNVGNRVETEFTLVNAEEWSKMVNRLKEGFSQAQLRQYLQESPNISKGRSRFLEYKKHLPKGVTATLIVKEAWGYKDPHPHSPDQGDNRHNLEIEVTLPMKNEKTLSAMQRDPSNVLKSIQDSLGVSVTSSVKEGQWFLTLKGPQIKVKQARLAVLTLHKGVKSTRLSLKNCLPHLRQQGSSDSIKALLRTLSTKYGVEIVVLKDTLQVMATKQNRSAIEQIKRDLLLAMDFPQKRVAWEALTSQLDQLVLVPSHVTTPAPWPTARHDWRRCVEPAPWSTRSGQPQKREAYITSRAKVLHGLQSALGDSMGSPSSADGQRVTLVASFGSVLFHQAQKEQLSLLQAQSSPRSSFSDTVPLLPQLLSHQKMQLRPEQSDLLREHAEGQQARLLFRPAESENLSPDIEVVVSQQKGADAADSVLVRSVSTIHDRRKFYALMPSSVVDINFTREVRRDIFRLDCHSESGDGDLQLLRSIDTYLQDASLASMQKGEVGCFLTLPISTSFKTSNSATVDQPSKASPNKRKKAKKIDRASSGEGGLSRIHRA